MNEGLLRKEGALRRLLDFATLGGGRVDGGYLLTASFNALPALNPGVFDAAI
jgi:hypothetical protein